MASTILGVVEYGKLSINNSSKGINSGISSSVPNGDDTEAVFKYISHFTNRKSYDKISLITKYNRGIYLEAYHIHFSSK